MKKYFPYLIFLFLTISALTGYALAGEADITFPVAELGGCTNKEACKTYCDEPENTAVCINFAEKNGLMSSEEAAIARKMTSGRLKGPGGCTTKDTCESFCNDIAHIEECVAFAEQNNLMPADELREAKLISAAIKNGVKPPACKNKKDCDNYCSAPEHMEECMDFAMQAGFMSEEEKADAQKMLTAIKNGVKPPPCMGKDECEIYCTQEENIEACADFALAAGFIEQKDYEMMKKTRGRGPGGCKGKDECETFCNEPANRKICFDFGKEHGLVSEENLRRMEEGEKMFKENISNAPPEVKKCLEETLGDLSNIVPSEEIGEKMRTCFEQFRPPMGGPGENSFAPPQGGGASGGGFTGPGGCSSEEECKAYCTANPSACGINVQQMPPGGIYEGMPPPKEGNYQAPPPTNTYQAPPPGSFTPPTEGTFTPPPIETITEPAPVIQEPAPSTLRNINLLMGLVLNWWKL